MIQILRWILFLPISIIAASIVGALATYIGVYILGPHIGWFISGLLSGATLMMTAYLIIPKSSRMTDIMISIITLILGALSAAGDLLYNTGSTEPAFLSGIAMVLLGAITLIPKYSISIIFNK